jgi:hypothetical protein
LSTRSHSFLPALRQCGGGQVAATGGRTAGAGGECEKRRYNPEAWLLRRPFSSPGYHTTLTGGMVHPTRDSARYAVALLETGDPERLERACGVLRRLLALQGQGSFDAGFSIPRNPYRENVNPALAMAIDRGPTQCSDAPPGFGFSPRPQRPGTQRTIVTLPAAGVLRLILEPTC